MDGEFYVSCETENLANEFLKYCYDQGLEWSSGESLVKVNCWDNSYDSIGYKYVSKNNYGMVQQVESKTSIEFTGFDTYNHIQKPKPPLGVMPKDIYEFKRVQDLCRALYERSIFEEVDYELMIKWSDELNDRLYGLKGGK